jgi:hypothetical protein
MNYTFKCAVCSEEFDVVQPMNMIHTALHCGTPSKRVWGCNTEKDLAYNFTTDAFGKPEVIYSRNQYRKFLKDNGAVDASIKEVKQEAAFRKRINEESHSITRRKSAVDIFCKMKARGQLSGRR